MSRVVDVVDLVSDDDEMELLSRLNRGEPLSLAPSPPRTRQAEQRDGQEWSAEMPALSPPADGDRDKVSSEDDGSSNGNGDESGDGTEEEEYEVRAIDAFRRVGRKRGAKQYRTVWKGGEVTWEPAGSFRLEELDEETGSLYLPLFDEFKSKMKRGEVEEYRD